MNPKDEEFYRALDDLIGQPLPKPRGSKRRPTSSLQRKRQPDVGASCWMLNPHLQCIIMAALRKQLNHGPGQHSSC